MVKVKVIDFNQLFADGNPYPEARLLLKGQQHVDAVIINFNHPEYHTHESELMLRVEKGKNGRAKLYQRLRGRGTRKVFQMKISQSDKNGFQSATFYVNMVRGTALVMRRLNEALMAINETAEIIN